MPSVARWQYPGRCTNYGNSMAEEFRLKNITQYAMEYGTYLGLFFIAKFIVGILSLRLPFLGIFMVLMLIAIPVVAYYQTRRFCDAVQQRTVARIWLFGIYLFFFAALLCGAAEYVYYRYINPDFLYQQQHMLEDMLNVMYEQKGGALFDEMRSTLAASGVQSPIEAVFSGIWGTVFFGSIYSLVLAVFMRRPQGYIQK